MRNSKCGDNPWGNWWFVRQSKKPPRYFCDNCWNLFRTGKFSLFDDSIYDDICPNCGAPGLDLTELAELYTDLFMEKDRRSETAVSALKKRENGKA